jgi:3'-phosphoadenosine 5'-phosphosulfate sulfotransferase (PAPS reductase)/FAD synthetase
MKHIVNFSGGDCSFWAAHRVIEKVGREDVVLLFADTLEEDDDLYAFNRKAEKVLGVKLTRVSREITIWDLFRREGLIGNNRFPICSAYLKPELLDEWMFANFEMAIDQANFLREHAISYIGFDWTEEHRLKDLRVVHPDWRIEAPMQWEPIWDKCRMRREAEALGLPEQKLYTLGFPHNNCGGCCVRAGISHWVHLYRTLPHRFTKWEHEEIKTAEILIARGIEPLSILKDRRGGETNNLYLWQLRERIESGEKFPRDEWGGCGCGGTAPKPEEQALL